MIEEPKTGKPWQDYELDAIVADYFDMLGAEVAGRPYVKRRHSEALMARIGRSHRSVEFKHQNISAVLEQLGMSWVPGYKPKRNYQNAIFDAIDRYLSTEMKEVEQAEPVPAPPRSAEVFVARPPLSQRGAVPKRLQRLIRKFDPVERDHRNRSLGKAGESFGPRLKDDSSRTRIVPIWHGKSDGSRPKKETAQDTMYCRSHRQAVRG